MSGFGGSSSGPSPEQRGAGRLFSQAVHDELYGPFEPITGTRQFNQIGGPDYPPGQNFAGTPQESAGGIGHMRGRAFGPQMGTRQFKQIDVPDYFPGQNFVGMSQETASGIGRMRDRADGTAAQRAIGGLGDLFMQGQAPGSGVAGQAQDAFGSGVAGLEGAAAGGGPAGGAQANQALAGYADGRVNPLTGQMFRAAAGELNQNFERNVLPGIQDMFAGSGGAGSSLAAGAVGNAAGDLADAQANMAAQMFGSASESALNRGLGAAQTLGSLYDAQQGRGLSAASQLAGLGMQGARMADNQAMAGAQLAGQADQMQRQGIQDLFAAGQAGEEATARQIAGDMERYNYTANMDQMQRDRNIAAMGAPTQILSGLPGTSSSFRMGIK